jgi:uncharacterized protein
MPIRVDFVQVGCSRRNTPPQRRARTVPVRTCVGCRRRATKSELLRVVAIANGQSMMVRPDPHGTAPGRGAHLHPTAECLDLAERRRAFLRALRLPGPLDLTALRHYVEQAGDDNTTSTTKQKRSTSS